MLENFLHNYKNPAYGPNLVIKQYRSLSKKYSVIYKLFYITTYIIYLHNLLPNLLHYYLHNNFSS